ncbi:hypothetical protein COT75_04035 [Candidatus Beckwithbacteria bacterium CG10_big_fil_rev_8_21_14_0_10_34_10]|uniref:Uncharacterized protein n=1 Tax=Candidatus Beckwithbacteria bacterium CG10_big_fil_rev_8_21_14_0_10_34_10 TaxID=1974495 RepID=A0A2H0W8M1_9BACT|nr:MAG: hypothetical protein COT75_04035 [Candidatus Beckwithbacteria bacterium CG10_big_fil_rev_8_21_14_0_10_34_10]
MVEIELQRQEQALSLATRLSEINSSAPEILSIWNEVDVLKAVELASQGYPIAFGVRGSQGRIYGFGGKAEAYLNPFKGESITQLKSWEGRQRDFTKKPPIALTSWERIYKLVDWNSLVLNKVGFKAQDAVNLVNKLLKTAHLILPITKEAEVLLPFAKAYNLNKKGHVFMEVGNDPLKGLVERFEAETRGAVFLATSANLASKPTLTTWRGVKSTFGDRLSLILAEANEESLAEGGYSSSIYDVTRLPFRIDALRLRLGPSHQRLVRTVIEVNNDGIFFHPVIGFSNLEKVIGGEDASLA